MDKLNILFIYIHLAVFDSGVLIHIVTLDLGHLIVPSYAEA